MVHDNESHETAAAKRGRGCLWLPIALATAVAIILMDFIGARWVVLHAWHIVPVWVGVAMLIRRSDAFADERIGLWLPITLIATSVIALIIRNLPGILYDGYGFGYGYMYDHEALSYLYGDIFAWIVPNLHDISYYALPLVSVIAGVVARRIMPEGAAVLIVVGASVLTYQFII